MLSVIILLFEIPKKLVKRIRINTEPVTTKATNLDNLYRRNNIALVNVIKENRNKTDLWTLGTHGI